MWQNVEKYENYHANSTSVLGPDVAEHRKVRKLPKLDFSSWAGCCSAKNVKKSTSFIVKTPFKSIAEHRKVRELPRKMNIEEVEEPKKYENLQTKPVLGPFKSTAEHRKVRELPRKMNIEEVQEPETTKIYRQNPCAPAAPPRKLRKFTDETNMQARKHENSDEFRHLDLDTRAFYPYRKNPKCYHTVWGKFAPKKNLGLPHGCLFLMFMCSFLSSQGELLLQRWRTRLGVKKPPTAVSRRTLRRFGGRFDH